MNVIVFISVIAIIACLFIIIRISEKKPDYYEIDQVKPFYYNEMKIIAVDPCARCSNENEKGICTLDITCDNYKSFEYDAARYDHV